LFIKNHIVATWTFVGWYNLRGGTDELAYWACRTKVKKMRDCLHKTW